MHCVQKDTTFDTQFDEFVEALQQQKNPDTASLQQQIAPALARKTTPSSHRVHFGQVPQRKNLSESSALWKALTFGHIAAEAPTTLE